MVMPAAGSPSGSPVAQPLYFVNGVAGKFPQATSPSGSPVAQPFYAVDQNGNPLAPDYANVTTLGADPTGNADSTVAIQNAINAVITAGGGPVFLPFGLYKISASLIIDADNISLVGLGTRLGTPTIQMATNDPTYALVVGNTKNVNNVLIQGINIQGLNSTTSTGGGINFRCVGGKINQVRVANFGGIGINVAAFSSTIFEVYLEDVTLIKNGMNSITPGDNLFIANTVTDFEVTRVISLGDATKTTTRHCINCAGGPGKFLLCHEYWANLDGIHITGNGNIEIIGGEHETNGANGINIISATRPVVINSVHCFANNAGDDISASSAFSVTNSLIESTNNGIYATFATGIIADNTFVGQGAKPIWIDTGCTFVSAHDNYIQNADPGIRIAGTSCTVHDNTILAGGIAEVTGANNNDIHDNFIASGKTITIIGTTTRVRNNPGFNPVGSVSAPGFPGTTVAATNNTGMDVTAFITNGTSAITQTQVAGQAGTYVNTNFQIAASGWGAIRIPAGGSVKFTYAGGAPAWVWMGD